jgi:hypothetical protein
MNLNHEYYDKVVVISLPDRKERLDEFFAKLPSDWPWKRPEPIRAVNGLALSRPKWWNSSPGAWGCYRSHLRVIEDALTEGLHSILILEDDARCAPEFNDRANAFYRSLPTHEGIQYLGGQHLKTRLGLPVRLNENCFRPFNVNRTHAYAIRGRSHMELIYDYLADLREWKGKHHIDHYYGLLHEVTTRPLFCPGQWLFHQAAGNSDITDDLLEESKFPGAETLLESQIDRKTVAVVGTYRSGSSLVAGMLHQAGIDMGAKFRSPDKSNPRGYFEAEELADLCRRIVVEPWLYRQVPYEETKALLRRWASDRCLAFKDEPPVFGGKHPLMCLLVHELVEAWENPYFICTDRPMEDTIASLKRTGWPWPSESIERMIPMMTEMRDTVLRQASNQVLRVSLDRARSSPSMVMAEVSEFLGVTLSAESNRTAIEHVKT